jgi:hypothetical protein
MGSERRVLLRENTAIPILTAWEDYSGTGRRRIVFGENGLEGGRNLGLDRKLFTRVRNLFAADLRGLAGIELACCSWSERSPMHSLRGAPDDSAYWDEGGRGVCPKEAGSSGSVACAPAALGMTEIKEAGDPSRRRKSGFARDDALLADGGRESCTRDLSARGFAALG